MYLWQIRHIPNSWPNLINLTFVAAIGLTVAWWNGFGVPTARGDAETKAEPSKAAEATALIKRVHEALYAHSSIKADIDQAVTIGAQQFEATGQYISNGPKLRLEYTIKADKGISGALVEVCDGKELWSMMKILESKRVTHRDVQQIKAYAAGSRTVSDAVLAAELGMGGLPALVASLERSMNFDAMKDETTDEGARTVIQGRWKPEMLNRWPRGKDDSLPVYIPDLVRITIDQTTMFPVRIVYVKRVVEKEKKVYRPMVSLKFRNVELDGPIDDQVFSFDPEGVVPEDITRQYLDRIKQAVEGAAAAAGAGAKAPGTKPATN